MFDLPDSEILPLSLQHNFWTWSAQAQVSPIPVKKAKGVYFWVVSGKRYLDFNSMVMCVNIGHGYCINTQTTKEVWRFITDHQVTGSGVLQDDSLYCGSVDGNLYCLDYRTGRLRWKYQSNGPITGTPAISGDLVYFGSADHYIYAIST